MLDAGAVRSNLECIRERIGPEVEILAATKYLTADELPALAEAGVELVGENRAQDLLAKQAAVQSRKLRDISPTVRLCHSIASVSALRRLVRDPAPEVLVQVNVAGEESKEGVAPDELGDFIAACPAPVTGLMTMPPAVERPEDSRRHFARLAELAAEHGLERLSMGTSQDYEVAVEEGATIVRLGTVLYGGDPRR